MMGERSEPVPPRARKIRGLAILPMGVLVLAFSTWMLAIGEESGRTKYSGLVVGVVLVGASVYELVRWRLSYRAGART